ncbi:MAG: GldG family protein [Polyangiaceae bacterium]|nr:GldG family protein [Polyangiaceae bacterium]
MGVTGEKPKKKKPKGAAVAKPKADKPAARASRAASAPDRTEKAPHAPGVDRATRISAAISVIAAVVLGFSLNVLASRHYKRWDLTTGGQFTLSEATVQTLGSLSRPIKLIVLLSKDDPLGVTVDEMLEGYSAQTNMLEIERVDPDRDQAKLLEIQKLYGVLAGQRGDRVVTDTAIIVVAGDRHHYIAGDDLVRMEDAGDVRARPRLEHAITGGIRTVLSNEKPTICFTTGHAEPSLEAGGTGFAELKERLVKNNFEVKAVFEEDGAKPGGPLDGCALLVLAGPRAPVPKEHVDAMKKFIDGGGDALLVVGPVPNVEQTDWIQLGVDDVVATAGVAVNSDLVFEPDPTMRPQRGDGEAFFPAVQAHPATRRLQREQDGGVQAIVFLASSLRDLGGAQKPETLLKTSEKGIGVADFWKRSQESAMKPGPQDHTGALSIATATELPPVAGKKRGSRIVVLGAISPIMGGNWREPDHYGTTLFVEGAIAWLTEHEAFLDIPDKPVVTSGLKLTEDALASIFRFVVVIIPLLVLIPGIVVNYLRRRRPAEKVVETT